MDPRWLVDGGAQVAAEQAIRAVERIKKPGPAKRNPPDLIDEAVKRARAAAMRGVGVNRAATFASPSAPLTSTLMLLGGL